MDLLEVLMDSRFLRFYSLPTAAVGSLWTLFAVLTAAVGIWGIRTIGSKPCPSSTHPSSAAATAADIASSGSCSSCFPEALTEETVESDWKKVEPQIVVRPSSGSYHVEEASTPKARFTAYYSSATSTQSESFDDEEEEEGDAAAMIRDDEHGVRDVNCRVKTAASWGEGWRVVVGGGLALRRRADLGWYRYQDTSELNGSVVRLWDGRRAGHWWSPAR